MTTIQHPRAAWSRPRTSLVRTGWTTPLGRLPRLSWLPGLFALVVAALDVIGAATLAVAAGTGTLTRLPDNAGIALLAVVAALALAAFALRLPERLPAWVLPALTLGSAMVVLGWAVLGTWSGADDVALRTVEVLLAGATIATIVRVSVRH